MKRFALAACLATGLLVSSWSGENVRAQSPEIELVINYQYHYPQQKPIIDNGRVMVTAKDMAGIMGWRIAWRGAEKKLDLVMPDHHVELRIGTTEAADNGVKIDLPAKPVIIDGSAYIPASLAARLSDGTVAWDPQSRRLSLDHATTYLTAETNNRTYWLNRQKGSLYFSRENELPALVGETGIQIYELAGMNASMEENHQTDWLSISDTYGEPHINTYIYRIALRDGQIVRQTGVHYQGFHSSESVQIYQGLRVLIDGGKLLLAHLDGSLERSYDLAQLCGTDDVFVVEKIASDFLLVRPYQTFNLILIDLKNNKSFELFRLLADGQEKSTIADWSSKGDPTYPGDGITFDKRDGNKLYFRHKELFGNKKSALTYTLEDISAASQTDASAEAN